MIDEKLLDKAFNKDTLYENNRYFSWEYCYIFFLTHGKNIVKNEDLQNLAALNLGFYLASWGMYRGSSKLLAYDYKIHKGVIKKLISECSSLWNKDVTWEELEKANQIIRNYYIKHGVTPTQTLITKVLMGIFACTPAYDRLFLEGLGIWNSTRNPKISKTYNADSFNALKLLARNLQKRKLLLQNIDYPPMRLIDTYFWTVGKNKELK